VDPGRLRYRPGLDGVRGLAVLAVLLYHGQVGWARGGFLGVDVFLVLSGFLITALLVGEWTRWGSIDLRSFWLRRARRLLPALFLVLVGVAVYAAAFAPAELRRTIRGDSLATLAYVANWRFVVTDQSYFARYDDPSPLRHMWSLGIEEQFYLVFPLLLAGLLLLLRGARRRRLAAVLGAGALASAGLMALLYEPGADPSRVYYGTDTRLQALLAGAVAAVLARPWEGRPPARSRAYLSAGRLLVPLPGRGVLAAAALLGLVAAAGLARESDAWLYRGGFLLVAVLSAVLVTVVAEDRSVVARLLGLAPLRWAGLVSYGLYLWHWPVYVLLTPERTGLSGPALLAYRLGVTALAATASYLLVERPVRAGALRRLPAVVRRAVPAGAVAAVLAAVVGATAVSGVATAPAAAGAPPAAAERKPGDVAAFLVGDSVPYSLRTYYRPGLVPGLAVAGSTELGCGLIPVPIAVDGERRELDPDCEPWSRRWPQEAAAARPDVGVVFVGIGEQFDHVVDGRVVEFGTPEYERHLTASLDTATGELGAGGRPVAVVDVACHRVPDSGLSADARIINDPERTEWLNAAVARYAARADSPRVSLIGLDEWLCADGYSDTRDGVELRSDGLHFTEQGAAVVWRWLGPRLLALAGR
jgi:peptidoglycan/LPS O-acetylase OafA/YrhL